MITDAALGDLFKIARDAVERLDQTLREGMWSAHAAHGLYAKCAHGATFVEEPGLVFTIFAALMGQRYPATHRLEVKHEYRYPNTGIVTTRKRADLALLEPAGDAMTLGACVEAKWWNGVEPERRDVDKMRERCPDPTVRKLMLLFWGLPNDSSALADWAAPQLRKIGLTFNESWCDSFPAAARKGPTKFSQEGRLWVALMEIVAG
jgi:hypothetical protein